MVKDDIHEAGYDKEAEYFYKMNKELIERKRLALDAKTASPAAKGAFWMVCPKCGTKMIEVDRAGIKIDECPGCRGVFFDAGELGILLEAKEPKGFFSFLKKNR